MAEEGDRMSDIERSPGHDLYREWVDAPGSDAAEREWFPMNRAVKERWEKLAARVAIDRGAVDALYGAREHIAAWSPHPDHQTRTLLARIDAALPTRGGQ
jgi:hypothetical protein